MTRRPSIRLQSGNHYFYDDPEGSIYTMEDVIHNLSKEPRFHGANDGDVAYSVLQHEVNASYLVAPEFALEALQHDNPEAFYKDVSTWLKGLCPDYKAQLKRGEIAYARRHGLPDEMSPEVKLADLQMLKLEKMALFQDHATEEGYEFISDIDVTNLEHLVDLTPWTPRMAKFRWMERYRELTNG